MKSARGLFSAPEALQSISVRTSTPSTALTTRTAPSLTRMAASVSPTKSALPGTSITLNFGNGTLSGFAGCNNYNAEYTTTLAAGNTNAISVGPITGTGQMCSEEIMNQEQAYLANLQSASSYTINGPSLTLQTAGGPLTFSAVVATPAQ